MTMTPGGAATDASLQAILNGYRNDNVVSATILSGQSLSQEVDLVDRVVTHIETPASWTAAGLTFQISSDGVTYQDYYDADGTEYSISSAAVVAGRAINMMSVPNTYWFGVRYLKIRSGTSGAPVNQGADRTFRIYAGLSA